MVASIPSNDILKGQYTGYIRDYTSEDMAVFFSIAENGITGDEITQQIKNVMKEIPEYEGKSPELLDVHLQKIWQYFPHVSPEEQKQGFYKKLEALQGKKDTFFVGSLFSFEIVGNTASYSKRLVEKNF